MNEEIFRKKSIDKIKSPENLNDYIHVTNPGIWILFTGIAVLLSGFIIWSIFGNINSTTDTIVIVEDGIAVCNIKNTENYDIEAIKTGMTVKVENMEGTISEINTINNENISCKVKIDNLEDGIYPGEIILESINPISFILN